MTQGALELTPPTDKKPRRRVRETSRAAYADGRARFTGRRGNTLRWLAHYFNRCLDNPTHAELAAFAAAESDLHEVVGRCMNCAKLYVARGLDDLQRVGVVASVKDRTRRCSITGSVCETWSVVSR